MFSSLLYFPFFPQPLQSGFFPILFHWNLVQDITDTYHLSNPMIYSQSSSYLISLQNVTVAHCLIIGILSSLNVSDTILFFSSLLTDSSTFPLQAPLLYIREPWLSSWYSLCYLQPFYNLFYSHDLKYICKCWWCLNLFHQHRLLLGPRFLYSVTNLAFLFCCLIYI